MSMKNRLNLTLEDETDTDTAPSSQESLPATPGPAKIRRIGSIDKSDSDISARLERTNSSLQSDFEAGVPRQLSIYESNIKNQRDLKLRYKRDYPHKLIENNFVRDFLSFGETHYDHAEESAEMWIWGLEGLRNALSANQKPSIKVLRTLMRQCLMDQPNDQVKEMTMEYLWQVIRCSSEEDNLTFLKCLSLKTDLKTNEFDPQDPWQFILFHLENDQKDKSNCNNSSSYILDFVCCLLENDFIVWYDKVRINGGFETRPMIAEILWPINQSIRINTPVKNWIEPFVKSLGNDSEYPKRLMAVVAQFLCVWDRISKSDELKTELMNNISELIWQFPVNQEIHLRVSLLKPDWFSMGLSYRLLNKGNMYESLSLRKLLFQVSPPVPVETDPGKENIPKVKKTSNSISAKAVMKRNQYGENKLHVACKKGNVGLVEDILSLAEIDINAKDNIGWTPMHEACTKGQDQCLIHLMQYQNSHECVDMLAMGGDDQDTPLHEAIDKNRISTVETIIKILIADPHRFPPLQTLLEAKNKLGQTPLDLAKSHEMLATIDHYSKEYNRKNNQYSRTYAKCMITLDNVSVFGFSNVLRKYCSEFSLHFIKEKIKINMNSSKFVKKRRFSPGYEIDIADSFLNFNFPRIDKTLATDIRDFNSLGNAKTVGSKEIKHQDFVRIISLFLAKH